MKFVIFLLIVMLGLLGIGAFLGPDDLSGCKEQPSGSGECQAAGAIIAISGGDTAARAKEAIRLYQNGWSGTLVFSGAAQDETGPSNAEAMRRIALDAGVPDEHIIIEEKSRTTRQNAEETGGLLPHGTTSVIIVTSGYHQRRASLEFTRALEGVDVVNHPVKQDSQWSRWWWTTPAGWYLAIGEVAKIAVSYAGRQ